MPAVSAWTHWKNPRSRESEKGVDAGSSIAQSGEKQTERSGGRDVLPYRIYTQQYDQVVRAASYCDSEELAALFSSAGLGGSRPQSAKQRWAGLIPAVEDTAFTLLLDNSGSLRGDPISAIVSETLAVCGDLETLGCKVEVLGFTTTQWRGGHSREDWISAGRPPSPGRLCDLLHVVYKGFDEPLLQAQKHFALMLKPDFLKENVDGEALQWASSRLKSYPAKRRILIVVSDGAPVDDSTALENSEFFLPAHLREVAATVEEDPTIELFAVGVGDYDVSDYYSNTTHAPEPAKLSKAIRQLFKQEHPHSSNKSAERD